jgi:adenosylcobinamide amidohydrolase
MVLLQYPGFTVLREHRFVKVLFHAPHRSLSTCAIHGGQREDLLAFLNCQTCEGSALHPKAQTLHLLSREAMHLESCREAALEPGTTAQMGTAANMDYVAVREANYEDARVSAIVTAGVEGNAGRAGDPAQWHEGSQGYQAVHAVPGTINIILLFHQSLSPAALARSAVTMTEAKSAALQDLAVGSRYSSGLATGTGTDQFAIASPLALEARFHWTGKHAKLGELVGTTVKEAVLEALRWQNGFEPSRTRSLFHALGRFGLREEAFKGHVERIIQDEGQRKFLQDCTTMLSNDPRCSASAYALAAVLDRQKAGVLPSGSARDAVALQCALLACAVSGKNEKFSQYLAQMQACHEVFPDGLIMAIYLGWRDKWC